MFYNTKPEKPVGHFVNVHQSDEAVYILSILTALLDDACNQLTYGRADRDRDVATLSKRVANEGISFVTKTLPNFINQLFTLMEGGEPSFEGFKKRPSSQLPVFLGGLTSMVIESVERDSEALDFLYSFCVAFKKLRGDYPESVLSDTLDKFIETDASLSHINLRGKLVKRIVEEARRDITMLFKHIDVDGMLPKPGSGATNTPVEYHKRFQPHVVYEQLAGMFPYPLWFYSNAWGFKNSVGKYFDLARSEYPTSRLKFIHKYVGKPRGICIEENETQYCQQAVKGLMYDYIERHHLTRGKVNFTDQEVNKNLALVSSLSREMSTIDMSEASDRISRELVFTLFRDTALLDYLDAVSTRVITFPSDTRDGELLVQKFAPMGSAVCFPVMAIVHWALIRAIIRLAAPGDTRKLSQQVYVYGDDIIVPSNMAKYVFEYLPVFGMKLNKEKSFVSSYFRESCGMHAYKGHDVTPVYNNYTLTIEAERDSTCLLSCLAKEALYFEKGFSATAAIVRSHISKLYGPIPYGGPRARSLCFKREHPDRYPKILTGSKPRYNTDLQRMEWYVRCVSQIMAKTPNVLNQDAALLRWFTTRAEESDSFRGFDDIYVCHRWLSEPDFG